jgi:AcrR family transcriptional regulator
MKLDGDAVRSPLGRPRSTEADDAIAQAALALLAESGFDGVTVEAVAARAGVARSTVYRRFPGKPELLVTVLQHACQAPVDDADTGSVVEDLLVVAQGLRHSLQSTELGRAIPSVIAAAARHPEVAEAHRTFVASRRKVSLAAVRRGIDRGEIDPEVDPDTLLDLVVGPVFHRQFVSRRPITDAWLRQIVTRAVRGCAPALSDRPPADE